MPGDESAHGEGLIRRLFRLSLLLKAAHAIIELAGGAALYLTPNEAILRLTRAVTGREMLEDPGDVVANYLLRTAEALSVDARTAAAIYLLSHGAVELWLVAMVWRGHRWAYPLFMAALGVLITYQSYQLSLAFSPLLAALTGLDLVMVWLTWHEYQFRRRA